MLPSKVCLCYYICGTNLEDPDWQQEGSLPFMPIKREAISKKQRFEILKRDSFTCRYCGAKAPDVLLHIEHIQPVAKGGTNHYENLIAACEGCNRGKGARLLTDKTAIDKSRDLIAKTQAEVEQLEEMIRWRKTVQNRKDKQRQFIVASLEEICGDDFTDTGRKDLLDAHDKFGFDICADHVAAWLLDCQNREAREAKSYSFSQYISYQSKKDTLDGRKRYLIGIARNTVSIKPMSDFANWLNSVEVTLGEVEELIQELKALHPHDTKLTEIQFIDWWHYHYITHSLSEGEKNCCEHHMALGFPS